MGCTALDPNMTGRDQALFLNEHIPAGLFGGVGVEESRVAWRLSPQPFGLAASTLAAIERLGPDLLAAPPQPSSPSISTAGNRSRS
jgi:hypothetical protein